MFFTDKLKVNMTNSPAPTKTIFLSLGSVAVSPEYGRYHAGEAYSIEMTETNSTIHITGASPSGVFYGIQTLISLHDNNGHHIPVTRVVDAPRFEYRGLMVDVARNFLPMKQILKILDSMATYKLNIFHFHLSDDQGWRLQIPGLEELTRVRILYSGSFFYI